MDNKHSTEFYLSTDFVKCFTALMLMFLIYKLKNHHENPSQ